MIANATLTRVDAVAGATPTGQTQYTTGPAIVVRCALAKPTRSMLVSAEAAKVTVTAALFVLLSRLGGVELAEGQRVAVKLDGFDAAARAYWVRTAARQAKAGGLSHYELGLEEATGV